MIWSNAKNILKILNMTKKTGSSLGTSFGVKAQWSMSRMHTNIVLRSFSRQTSTKQYGTGKFNMTKMKFQFEIMTSPLRNFTCTIKKIYQSMQKIIVLSSSRNRSCVQIFFKQVVLSLTSEFLLVRLTVRPYPWWRSQGRFWDYWNWSKLIELLKCQFEMSKLALSGWW